MSDTNGVTLKSYTNGVSLDISFKTPLPNGIYRYVFDIFLQSCKTVKVFLYGECGGTGFKASTRYKYWNWSGTNKVQQTDAAAGYFHRIWGKKMHIEGAFRYYGKYPENYGISHSLGDRGQLFEFLTQNLTANSDQPVLLGYDMSWDFQNETAGSGLTLGTESYFYIEKFQTI